MVVLPEHLHAIWTLPEGDKDFALRWRLIKSHFTKALPNTEPRNASHIRRRERGIWQLRYWEHCITDDDEFHNHVANCYFNPVKHGLVERVEDWPYSSFHREFGTPNVQQNWDVEVPGEFDERE